jgi:peptide/nickel transport system substrate-binding protein
MILAACPAGQVDTGAVATQVVAAVQTAAPTLQAVATEVAPVVEQAATQVAEVIQPSTEVTATAATDEDPCAYGGIIKDIVAVDELTVRFDLCVPDPAFPAKAAFSAFQIQSADYLESTGGGGDLIEKPVGTGPYMMKEWRRGDQLILEANPNYWGDAAKTSTVVFRWSPEAAQRLLELQSGNVSGIDNPGPDDFDVIEGRRQSDTLPPPWHQRLLCRHEQHLRAVRQRAGAPGFRHGD